MEIAAWNIIVPGGVGLAQARPLTADMMLRGFPATATILYEYARSLFFSLALPCCCCDRGGPAARSCMDVQNRSEFFYSIAYNVGLMYIVARRLFVKVCA